MNAITYFTKWVEAVSTINGTYKVVIKFLEENILARFGCPRKIMTDNAQDFKSNSLMIFCDKYNIKLSHSTPYYPQGKELAESSNKIFINIIKKLLLNSKKGWDHQLKYALWEDMISVKKSIGTSPFQLVYGIDVIFLMNLAILAMKLFQDEEEEQSDVQRRINQMIKVNQIRESLNERNQAYKDKVKAMFDRRVE